MSFKPIPDQAYFLFPKHSTKGLVVGGSSADLGAGLQLQVLNFKTGRQKFTFARSNRGYWPVLAPWHICVHNASQESHTERNPIPILQWHWNPDGLHHQFRFIHAGGGYYRIMALHSQKFWDAYGKADLEKTPIVQHTLSLSDNQLFMPIPVPNQPLVGSPQSLQTVNDNIRKGVMGVIGLAPKIGGGLQFVVALFWSEKDKLADLWNQMKVYVDARVRALILEAQLKRMGNELIGITDLLKEIYDSKDKYKGPRLAHALDMLTIMAPQYLNSPVEVLPYLMGFGTIVITLRRMMVTDYDELFEVKADKEKKDQNLALLQEAITKYGKYVADAKEELLKWRGEQIPGYTHEESAMNTYRVVDNYNGWSLQWKYKYNDKKAGERCREAAQNAIDQRRKQVAVQFETELNDYMKPAGLWPYFEPGKKLPDPVRVNKSVGKFGGPYEHNPFSGVEGKRISKIITHSDPKLGGFLTGIEVFYDGVSDGLKGTTSKIEQVLELSTDEYIAGVYGYAQDKVDGVWFTTNKAQLSGGGETLTGVHFFSADVADGYNPKLVRISGSHNGNTIETLEFHWEYFE